MLVGRDFVFIHMPKTGGNFVRGVLLTLLVKGCIGWRDKASLLLIRRAKAVHRTLRRLCPRRFRRKSYFHANCERIPEAHQHKLVLSIKRDPLAYHVSCYCYLDGSVFLWRKRYWGHQYRQAVSRREKDRINSRQEEVPDFGEFVRFFNEELPRMHFFLGRHCHLPSSIGFMSYIYIWYFFKEPVKVLSKTDAQLAEYFQSRRYRQDMHRVHFLRTEHLNADLHDFLLSKGFHREVLQFIPTQGRVNANVTTDSATWFTPELIDYIKEKNRIYYRYFWRDGSVGSTESLDGCV